MIILAGAEYGSGSSRDWAAKGPMLLVHSGGHLGSTDLFMHILLVCLMLNSFTFCSRV